MRLVGLNRRLTQLPTNWNLGSQFPQPSGMTSRGGARQGAVKEGAGSSGNDVSSPTESARVNQLREAIDELSSTRQLQDGIRKFKQEHHNTVQDMSALPPTASMVISDDEERTNNTNYINDAFSMKTGI